MARKDLTADEKLRAKAAAKFGNNGTYNKGAGIKPSVRNEELTASQRLRIKAAEVERQKQYEAVTAQRKEAEERHQEHIQTAGTPYSNRFGGLRDDENMWMAPVERYAADKEVGELEAELSHAEKMYDVYSDLYGSWQTSPEEKAQALEWRNRFGAQIEDITGGTLAEAKNKQHDATANYYATLTRRPDFASGSAKGAAIDNGFKTSEIEGAVTNWEFFTDAEKDIYNYLLGTGGEEAAEAYWKYMQEPAQQRLGNIYTDRVQSIDSDFGRFLAERAYGIGAGVENALGGFMQATTEKELPTSGTQFGYYQMGEGKTGLDKITYELGYQAGNMLPSMLLSGGLSAAGAPAKLAQLAGSGAMGFSAGGNAYKQGLDMGMTTEQAKAYGRLIGASEGGLQYALGGISALGGTSGKFAEAVKGIENGFLRFIAQTGGSMVSEATEEGLQAILDPIFRNAASGAEINIDWSEVAYNALMGGLMGGVFEAPSNAVEAITAGRGDAMYTPNSFKGENFAFEGLIPANVSQPGESGNSAEIHPDSPGLAQAREQLRQSALATAEKNFGREGYSAFEGEAASMDNPADLFGEMSRAYNDGLVNRHAKSFGRLTESQYERMFAAGRSDAAESVRSQMQNRGRVYSYKDAGIDMSDTATKEYAATLSKKDAKALDNASKRFGVKIRFADSVAGGDANAEIKKGIITIEKGNPHPLRFLFGHEITHRMQELAPQEYARLRAAVAANATEFNVKTGDMMMAYAEKNRSITQDAAVDEVIANELGLMLEDNAELERFIARFSNERTLLERLMDVIREIRIKLVGTEQERRLLEVEKRLDEAAKAAAKQAQSNAERAESANVGAVSDKAVTVKVRKAVQEGKAVSPVDEVNYSLKMDSKFMADAEKANAQYKKVSPAVMKKAAETRQAIADIFNDPDLADSLGLPPDIIGNTYIPNGSYSGTEENTTVCIRSISADALMDAVAEYLGRPLTVQDTITISQELMRFTDKPECLYCYVAMDRKAHREFLGSYLKQRDDAISNIRNGMSREEAYEKFRDGRKDTKPMRDRFNMWLKNMDGEMITPEDLASYANMEKAMERNPALKTQINDALKYAQSASWAKKRMSYSAYNGHILKWKWDRIRKLNSNYGLRMYSFSDFSPAFILENMQMITDAAVRDLKVLAYTKELDFVRIFAGSGMNINISVFGYDYEGGVAMDAMQGADWAEAQALRQQYPNVGCTFVATNDGQVNWALEQDWIDVIIPFHMVRTGSKVASYFNWKNYTAMSADTKAEGWTKADAKHILPPVHQNDKAKYLEACRKNHLTPRFNDWVEHPNYMKLVNETRRSERETKAVQPIFDLDAAKASIEDMRKRGGYYTPIGGTEENMRDIAAEIGDSIEGRFSLKDSDGRELSRQQQEYFKDSKVRDENGNLKVMYHGTSGGGFTVFDPYGKTKYGLFGNGSYFTDNKSVAESYMDKGRGKNRQIYETYLNITNPIDMDAPADAEAWRTALPDVDFPDSGTNENFFRAMEEYFRDEGYTTWEAADGAMEVIEEMGFDGITHIGGGRFNKADGTRHRVYIAFWPNQVKNTDNLNPTVNKDIRYSLKDSDSLAREIKRIQTEGAKAGHSDADIQKAVTQTINSRMAQREIELKAKYAADMSAQKQKQAATAKAVGEKNKAIVKEKVKAERSKAAAAINTQREKQKAAVAKERQKRDEAIDKLKARNKERIAAEKEKKHEAIDKLKEKQKEKDAKASENRKAKELRQKIQRHASGLSQKLVHPTDKKHIPQKLQSAVAKLLHSINLESNFDYVPGSQRQTSRGATIGDRAAKGSGEPTNRTQAFNELRKLYKEIAGEVVYDPDMDDILADAIALADKPIAAMKSSELEVLWKALRAVENTVRTANKTFVQGRWQTVSEAAEAIRSENSGKKQQTEYKYIQKLKKLTGIDMMTPEAYFHRLGKAGDTIFRMMRNAQDKHIRLMSEISDFTHEQIGKVDVRKLEKELHTVTLGGEEVQLSTAQIMELYVLMRREQAAEHISVGGILPDSVDGKGIKKVSRAKPIRGITAEELSAAFNELTDEQVELAGKLQEYSSTTLSKWGNEAAMQVYNYEKFGEKNYWPIRVNKQETQSDVNKDSAVVAIGGKGFTKATTPHANNSVRIGSIFDTFSTHASEMATYAAWLATAEDINRIRNYTFRDPDSKQRTDTVKGIIETVHGKDGTAYLQKLLEDIANGVKGKHSETEYMSGIVGNYKAASVGANIRVMIQQPTAILRAMEMIDAKYLAKGLKPNKGWEKAVKYAPIAKWKDWGYFDINTGRQMKDVLFDTDSPLDKTRQFLMAGAGKMDSLAWGQLWNAVEAETKDKQPELEAGSEEYYEAVAKRFTEIVDRTQVVDGILQRSQIMRSSNSWTKMATSFMAEPTKQYNMMVSAAYDVMTSTGEAKKNAQKHFARTTAALLISGVSNAIAQSIVDALRDDDREKKYWEKWLEAFTGFTGEEENFSDGFKAFWNGNVEAIINPAGYVPFVKDFLSLLQGYDVSRMDMESVEKVLRAVNTFRQAWSGSGKEPFINASANMFAEAARLLGIPAANIKRDVFAVINLVANETDNYLFQYRIEKFLSNMNYSSNSAKFVDILYNAYVLDPEAYEIIYADMVASGFDPSKIKSGIEKRLKEAYGVDEVELLPQRYMTPEQQKSYDAVMDKVEKSDIWKNADARVRKNVSYDYYEVATGASSAQGMVDKMEMAAKYGIDSVEFLLYEAALGMADKPNDSGSYGTYTNAEIEEALNAVPGLSRTEKSNFWEEVLGKSEKNNPWG